MEGIDGTGEAHEETLSILYRRKCVEWQHEMKQRRKVMGVVREHVFGTRGTGAERPGSAGKGQSEDPVGSLLLETGMHVSVCLLLNQYMCGKICESVCVCVCVCVCV